MTRHHPRLAFAAGSAAFTALALAACGGGDTGFSPPPSTGAPVQTTRVELLASAPRAIGGIVYKDGAAWMAMANSAAAGSAVMKAALPLSTDTRWTEVPLGACALPKQDGAQDMGGITRTPALRMLGDKLWLFQTAQEKPQGQPGEHALCAFDGAAGGGGSFVPRDAALENCLGGYCAPLAMDELKLAGGRLYSNAGAGQNLFVSNDGAASWKVAMGQFDSMICTHQAFHIVGDRLLVGGECPLDMAYVRAYKLGADGMPTSKDELPLTLPKLENRNVQFIDSVPGTQRVFAGVEGGLLRSEDGGQSFRFVIEQPVEGNKNYPYIRSFLALKDKPETVVVGGFDKATALPYLAWSADGGSKWTDISALLPGYARAAGDSTLGDVTSLSQDPQGRVLVTLSLKDGAEGRLLLLTLGKP